MKMNALNKSRFLVNWMFIAAALFAIGFQSGCSKDEKKELRCIVKDRFSKEAIPDATAIMTINNISLFNNNQKSVLAETNDAGEFIFEFSGDVEFSSIVIQKEGYFPEAVYYENYGYGVQWEIEECIKVSLSPIGYVRFYLENSVGGSLFVRSSLPRDTLPNGQGQDTIKMEIGCVNYYNNNDLPFRETLSSSTEQLTEDTIIIKSVPAVGKLSLKIRRDTFLFPTAFEFDTILFITPSDTIDFHITY
jgi:hypothetical protein